MNSSSVSSQPFNSVTERGGLGLIGAFGTLSAVATFCLLSYFLCCCVIAKFAHNGVVSQTKHHRTQQVTASGISVFLHSTLGRYLSYLILCDFVQGIAFAINLRWAGAGVIREGTACTVQGVLDQIGNLGTALWSLLMCFQTFCLLFLQVRPHPSFEIFATGFVWSIVTILPIVGPLAIQDKRGSFWSISGIWCWIGPKYSDIRLLYLYAWIFATLASCLCMYTLIYLKFTGVINYLPGMSFKQAVRVNLFRKKDQNLNPSVSFQPGQTADLALSPGIHNAAAISKQHVKIAQRLMWYPFVYAVVIIPVAVCRLGALAGWKPPFGLYVFAGICYTCSGLSNTILFLLTRHTFIQRRAMTALTPAAAHGVSITIDVTRTSDYPRTPLRLDTKKSWELDQEGLELGSYVKSDQDSIGPQSSMNENDFICTVDGLEQIQSVVPWEVEETSVWGMTKSNPS